MTAESTDIIREPLPVTEVLDVAPSFVPGSRFGTINGRRCDGFLMILSGFCDYRFRDGSGCTARKGDVIYLADRDVYQYDVGEYYSFIFCDFRFTSPVPGMQRKSMLITPGDPEETEKDFRLLQNAWRNDVPDRFPACMTILYRIYGSLIRAAHMVYVNPGSRARIEAARRRIAAESADSSLTVASLARGAGMSEVYFRKLFTEMYAVTPSRCITAARIAAARELMFSGTLTLEEVAQRAGFSSLPYFCKVFKSRVGVTPAAYRREMRT